MLYPKSFEAAVNHAMLYEVGGFWNVQTPGVLEGLISTQAQRKAVGYVNDPFDRGGETKYGVAKNANPELVIASLDWEGAKRVYYRKYWLGAHCDELTAISPQLAVLHFDGAVNHGPGKAAKFLQEAVNVDADGDIGPATIGAVKKMNPTDICNAICNRREAFYRSIVAARPEQARFLNGWLRRITEMRAFVTSSGDSFI